MVERYYIPDGVEGKKMKQRRAEEKEEITYFQIKIVCSSLPFFSGWRTTIPDYSHSLYVFSGGMGKVVSAERHAEV